MATADSSRSVLLIDDDVAWRTALERALRHERFHVAAAASFADAHAQVTCRPDAVIMESIIGREACLTLLRFIQSSKWYPHVTVLSGRAPRPLVFHLRERGVSAFLEKPQPIDTLLRSLKLLWKSECVCSRDEQAPAATTRAGWLLEQAKEALKLTPAELDILRYAAYGYGRNEIAQLRHTTENTVKSQIRALLDKAQSRNLRHLLRRIDSGALSMDRSDSGLQPRRIGEEAQALDYQAGF